MIVKCKTCSVEFEKIPSQIRKTNNNFCSRSCAAKTNNLIPKRKKRIYLCRVCNEPCGHRKFYCNKCRPCTLEESNPTLKELIEKRGYQKHSRIRDLARKKYKKFNKEPFCCYICQYSIHVEVCHIKAIKDFSKDAKISEINDVDNLVALCRNCHWELDNGIIKI